MDPQPSKDAPYTDEQYARAADDTIPDDELTSDELEIRYGGHPPPCEDEHCAACDSIAFDVHSRNWWLAEKGGIVRPGAYDVLYDRCPGINCPYCGGVEPGQGVR